MVAWPPSLPVQADAQEKHLKNLRQLTFGGQNAEAYWSSDGKYLTFQSAQPGYPDEQIFAMKADGTEKRLVSTGAGRCTCSYFTPDNKWLYFSSTHERDPGPQPKVDMSKGYVWMVNPRYAMYRVPAHPKKFTTKKTVSRVKITTVGYEEFEPEPLVKKAGYVAETTIAPNGKFMVFTGSWEGDLEIYRANLDGTNIQRLTHEIGYDGGPFVSWDSKKIVYRRQAITSEQEKTDYLDLLHHDLIRPGKLEIWMMDPDGSNKKQITHLGCASFAPFMHPDGKRIVFSSNYGDPAGREFDIFMINTDGTGLERITFTKEFDGFPMFSRDGKKLVFASNRFGKAPHETNIFVADWVN